MRLFLAQTRLENREPWIIFDGAGISGKATKISHEAGSDRSLGGGRPGSSIFNIHAPAYLTV